MYEQIVKDNMKMIRNLAKRYLNTTDVKYKDLVQEGVIAVIIAAQKYDETKGKFSTYAYPWIKERLSTTVKKHNRGQW